MRNFSVRTLAALALCLGFAACGGDDGDDGVTPTIDAPVTNIDAAVDVDAPPATSALGQACSQTVACPAAAPDCIILNKGDTTGFCTLNCGTSQAAGTPPANGDAACAAQYAGDATPACVFRDPNMPAPIDWSCGVLCGQVGAMDFGTCPSGQTCDGLTAQQPGVCYPMQ